MPPQPRGLTIAKKGKEIGKAKETYDEKLERTRKYVNDTRKWRQYLTPVPENKSESRCEAPESSQANLLPENDEFVEDIEQASDKDKSKDKYRRFRNEHENNDNTSSFSVTITNFF